MTHNYTNVPTNDQDEEDAPLGQRRFEPTRPDIPSTSINIVRGDQIEQPGALSTVVQIRKYIVQVLHGCYDVPLEDAQLVAAIWKDKLGEEFVAMKRGGMEEMLGKPYADLLWAYKDARERHDRAALCQVVAIVIAVFLLAAVIMTACFLADRYQKEHAQV